MTPGIIVRPDAEAEIHVCRALLRRFPYGIFYLHEDEEIIVLACFHGSRDPKQWRDRA